MKLRSRCSFHYIRRTHNFHSIFLMFIFTFIAYLFPLRDSKHSQKYLIYNLKCTVLEPNSKTQVLWWLPAEKICRSGICQVPLLTPAWAVSLRGAFRFSLFPHMCQQSVRGLPREYNELYDQCMHMNRNPPS